MKNILELRTILKSISIYASFFFLMGFITMCSLAKERQTQRLSSLDQSRMRQAFDKFQIIGEGTDFLTIKCDIPQTLTSAFRIYALLLDKDGYPLRKISGYTYNPKLKQRNHIWFYFFLYAPREAFPMPFESEHIKFIMVKGEKIELRYSVKNHKTWDAKKKAKIFDLPSPPDQIPGFLILKDYTFWAKEDFRKPRGYYVEGGITGRQGRWTHFIPLSNILGKEESALENILAADQGWLELTNGSTHSLQEAVSPVKPYIEGWWDGKGYFHPRPVKIHGLKNKSAD
jgi:hypothetical protein